MFTKYDDHHYEFGQNNVIYGIDLGQELDQVRNQIKSLFPDYETLTVEKHLNLMVVVPEDNGCIRYHPMSEICFCRDEENEKYVRVQIKHRNPELGHVTFKDKDIFAIDSENIGDITNELVEILIQYYVYLNNSVFKDRVESEKNPA